MSRSPSPVSGGVSEVEERNYKGFPPYPSYAKPAPPSVAEVIAAGHGLRQQHKSKPRKSLRPLPKPAKPRSPKATDVKMSYHAMKAHARCLRRHGGILTDRLERIAKPRRRTIIYFWRDNAHTLPADTISRLRSMLDADEPFKPDQAYAYFVNLKKSKKKAVGGICFGRKDMFAMCNEKKYVWARHATVAFAKGIQRRLGRPGHYALADGMLRLSNNILQDICGIMKMKTPTRLSKNPKAKFMMEMADKIAVWIDEILSESDDRMLMMDFDEDAEVEMFYNSEGMNVDETKNTGTADERRESSGARSPPRAAAPATSPRTSPSTTPGTGSPNPSAPTSGPTSAPTTPPATPDVLLAAKGGGMYGDGDDDRGDGTGGVSADGSGGGAGGPRRSRPAYLKFEGNMKKSFEILTDAMVEKGDENLLTVGKFNQTYQQAAKELKSATDLTATEYSAEVGEKIYDKLDELTKDKTPPELGPAMIDVLEICTNYLAQNAEYNKAKGPAFKLLVSEMNKQPNVRMYEKGKIQKTNAEAAKELERAKGLETDHDEPTLTETIFGAMKKLVSRATPKALKQEMEETVDSCSKYLSQKAVDDIERGPAFDLLIKELEKHGDKRFTEFPTVKTRDTAAYVLKSAPGLGSSKPDPKTLGEFKKALHSVVDASTPIEMREDMTNVINLCSNYLSAFVRDRGLALQNLLSMMKKNPKKVYAKRNNHMTDYATAADELENAPTLVPYLPIKDIADEGKANLTRDMKGLTPPDLMTAMTSLIKDASKHLSQLVALESGAAGERYKMNFLSAVTKSMGEKPLYKYKSYAKTYGDAASDIQTIDSTALQDLEKPVVMLGHEIKSEMKRGIPTKVSPKVAEDTGTTIEVAAMHLAKIGVEKGDALDYVVTLMKDKGDEKLGKLQGYEQTYSDGARRIENTLTLHNSTVDMAAYSNVKGKLTHMVDEKPDERYTHVLPDVIDDSANFLAKPLPKTNADQKQVLADLLGRKGSEIIGEKDAYKLTYQEGGQDIRSAPVGASKAHDEEKMKVMAKQIASVIPDKRMESILQESTKEGAVYLTDAIEGRGQALKVIEASLKKEGHKEFIDVGAYKKDHVQVADMLVTAPHLKSDHPSPVILENVEYHLDVLPKETPPDKPMAVEHMKSMTDIAAQYIASEATKKSGLNAEQLAALDAAGFNAEAKALAEKRRLAALAGDPGSDKKSVPGSQAEREARKLLEEEKNRLRVDGEKRKKIEDAEKLRRAREKYRGGALGSDYDLEHLASLDILHQELQAHGPEIFYEQPQTSLTHGKASDWLKDPEPIKVEKSVRDSGDTARLHKKFERKLTSLVKAKTPPPLNDAMQDVVIEAARKTAEYFVDSNFKALVKDGLVSAMQSRGNEILVEVDGAAETHFFAAQRLKRRDSDAVHDPCYQIANDIEKKLDDAVRTRPQPKKLSMIMKENVKDTSKFLSSVATKPDDYIEAYVELLAEMEDAGDAILVEGEIPKTSKESAKYLRTLTTFNDIIGRPNRPMQTTVETKLKNLMSRAPSTGRKSTASVMNSVIADSTKLLVSYVMSQAAKAKALDLLVKEMKDAGDGALLRHGPIRKSFKDGADLLEGKTSEDLNVSNADPVVARKIQIKLNNLMLSVTPAKFETLMDEVITEATTYLAVHLLEPKVFKVCKCYKNVFVQCELWCDEILRRVGRPCCTCSRHVSAQALTDLAPADFITITPDQSRALAPGVEISFKPCPNQARLPKGAPLPLCPGLSQTTAYFMYEISHNMYGCKDAAVQPQPAPTLKPSTSRSYTLVSPLQSEPLLATTTPADHPNYIRKQEEQVQFAHTLEDSYSRSSPYFSSYDMEASSSQSNPTLDRSEHLSSRISQAKSEYSSRTPIMTADHMLDWDATMVSLLWNVLAWRGWIQEIVDHALAYRYPNFDRGETAVCSWLSFYRRVTTEALKWRQYSVFSRQLTNRVHLQYRNKEIEPPNRSTEQTKFYIECQEAMLDIIEMFHRWTQWLTLVVKETDLLQQIPGSEIPLRQIRWNHLKMKVEGYSKDWMKYNTFLKVSWEQKYSSIIAEYLPSWKTPGPVWVVSACGAVPSGAVAAGMCDGEVIWLARTMHRGTVLPATLLPSKHCCLVYAEGQVHSYSKYQVMCNAEVCWLAWRGGSIPQRAVCIAPGMHVGRVLYHGDHILGAVSEPEYHCHVVIFGRPFAFNCYELLMPASEDDL